MKIIVTQPQNLKVPPQYTQAELVLAVLQSRGATTTDIFEDLGIKSPSSVIHRLRKSGYLISTKLLWKKTAKYSWYMIQAEYTLETSPQPASTYLLSVNYTMEGM